MKEIDREARVLDLQLQALRELARDRGCIMCPGPADVGAVFIPYEPQEWGAPEGKTRFVGYGICEECLQSTSLEEREDRLAYGRRAA